MEVDSYRLGCFQIINEYIQLYSRLIVAIGIGIALLEVKNKISKTKFHFGFYF